MCYTFAEKRKNLSDEVPRPIGRDDSALSPSNVSVDADVHEYCRSTSADLL
jgi:hypothetical protein